MTPPTRTLLTPTAADAATARPSPMVYVPPPQQVTDETQRQAITADGDLDRPFLADLLSAAVTHERCGRHLYRAVAERTHNPVLRRSYEAFGEETEEHVRVYERLIEAIGGQPAYVSPMARAVEASDAHLVASTYLLAGSGDEMLAEMVMLDAVFVAETLCHANWQLMGRLTAAMPEGALRTSFADAVREVEAQEDEHLRWAHDTKARMAMLQARSRTAAKAGAKAEELVARIREWFA